MTLQLLILKEQLLQVVLLFLFLNFELCYLLDQIVLLSELSVIVVDCSLDIDRQGFDVCLVKFWRYRQLSGCSNLRF